MSGARLARRAGGDELTAGVLAEAVEEPVGNGEGVVVGATGRGEAADQHVEARHARASYRASAR